ncbi:MAG: hypothetical protein GY796_16610 [Chloroflexi bacterium]|nr:hypothetical protein [Chloroflexota bacterium]
MQMLKNLFSREAPETVVNLDHPSINEPTPKRILVLGSSPHTHLVTAYSWDKLPSNLNVANYDVVILNLVPFAEDENLARGINLNLLPSRNQFGKLLFSEGSEIIALGTPGVELGQGIDENADKAIRMPPLFHIHDPDKYVTW